MRRARRRAWMPLVLGAAVGLGAASLIASPSGRAADLADLGSSDRAVRGPALSRLVSAGASPALDDLLASDAGLMRAGLIEVVRQAKPTLEDIDALRRLVAHRDMGLRLAAVHCVQETPALLENELEAALAHEAEHPLVRGSAARALGNLGAESRAVLRPQALNADVPVRVRRSAIAALAHTGTLGCTDLAALAQDPQRSRADRAHAIASLALPAVKARGALTKLLGSATAWIREHATAALGAIGHKGDVTRIVGMAIDPSGDVRLAALMALIEMGEDGAQVTTVLGLLADADARVQRRAAESLRSTGMAPWPATQAALQGLLASANFLVRYEAALALGAYGSSAGVATMTADAAAGPKDQRIMATQALSILAPSPSK